MSLNIAVLITCHNRKEKTLSCLQRLFAQESNAIRFNLEAFLVDDGSTDGTAIAVKQAYPQVNVIQGTGNLFWNRGMYLAWTEAAKSAHDYFLWLNDDTFIYSNAIVTMLQSATETGNNAIICGPTCSAVSGALTYSGSKMDQPAIVPNGQLQICDFFNGNFILVPNCVYNVVGMLDPLFHHAIGDQDYGLRAKKLGISSYVAPGYIGTCEKHDSLPSWCLPETPIIKRFKSLYSPLGNGHPYYIFHLELRHKGLLKALKLYTSVHLRLLMPYLWK
jgi:GT2 family glycosyltransferase